MTAKTASSREATGAIIKAAATLRTMFTPQRVIDTWLDEFGYTSPAAPSPFEGAADTLEWAVMERGGPRLRLELLAHAKRLAERQTMGSGRIAGRSSVIAP